ncbi:MAG TPA: sn-glycerol-3-phosphate ABC transporter ATP-binding protein UgpC [Thermoanaerobaculia bacterium]|nr:sn-glycerol-3-phosphate ABC transporter ATP-binding protein UgpC [Thermoanaerobaculia bacterium]
MAQVVLKGVTKRYGAAGDVAAVDSLDLTVEDHELMVLVGPSGCGKSTALRMIAGLEEVTEGTVSIGDRVVNDLPPKDRDIAMVFQSYALYPHMTVRRNLEYGLKMRKVPAEERNRLVEEAAEILGIDQLLERKPKALSGGQRQRVAVGRAIVRKPAVFLFDEPLSNLDAKFRMQMRAEIARLQNRLATTTVYVTHDQVEAMTMGSRIAVMRGGKLQQVGTPLDVYQHPANLFVAGFVGSPPMNFLPVKVGDRGTVLTGPDFELPVPSWARAELAGEDGRELIAGIRPERVSEAKGDLGPNAVLAADVELAEPLGSEVVVHARHGGELLIARLGPERIPAIGERLELALDLAALHLFDAGSELRLESSPPVPSPEEAT